MAGQENINKTATENTQQADSSTNPGKASNDRVSEQEVEQYMSNLGGGTGVDIGPGAAGEMSDSAQKPKQSTNQKTASEQVEYPDSGDLPQINR